MEKKESSAKSKIITFLVGVILIAGIAGGVLFYQSKGYHSIAVNEIKGEVTAVGQKKDGKLFVGEHLYSGDHVSVAEASGLTLCADTNKYLYADENTSFRIEFASDLSRSTVKISMESGSTLSVLNEKLGENDVYEVSTPNSVMSVRGTSFRVTVYESKAKKTYTLLEVEKGSVQVNLAQIDGKYAGEEELFEVGECAVIKKADEEEASFMTNEDGNVKWKLDYEVLPEENVERLVTILEDAGENLEPEPEPEPAPKPTPAPQPEPTPVPTPEQDNTQTGGETQGHVHTPGEWEVTKEANCTEDGTRVKRCTVCGEIVQAIADPAHHNYEEAGYSVTNCEDGGTVLYRCSVCGDEREEVYPPQSHKWVQVDPQSFGGGTNAGGVAIGGGVRYRCEICGQLANAGTRGGP